MKVAQLQSALGSVASVLRSSGAGVAANEVEQVSGLLQGGDSTSAASAIEALAAEIETVCKSPPGPEAVYLARLKSAAADFDAAKQIVSEIEGNRAVSKTAAETLAAEFIGTRITYKTRAAALKAMEAHAFATARSASQHEILKKVTPW